MLALKLLLFLQGFTTTYEAKLIGYRPGYVDLCRLFTSSDINEWYCHIALASEELREEFDYMKDVAGATPLDYALKVRTHPGKLQITATNKMRTVVKDNYSFSTRLAQAYLLRKDRASIEENLLLTQRFIDQLGIPQTVDKDKFLWRTNDYNTVIAFLSAFKVHPNLVKVSPQNIVNYIKMQIKEGELTEWVIAIPQKEKTDIEPYPFTIDGKKLRVKLIKRKHQEHIDANAYFVNRGHLLSPHHEFFDIENPPLNLTGKKVRENNDLRPSKRVLLLLYPLSPVGIVEETDLPLMSFAISFPKSNSNKSVEYAIHEQLLDRFNNDDELDENDYEHED